VIISILLILTSGFFSRIILGVITSFFPGIPSPGIAYPQSPDPLDEGRDGPASHAPSGLLQSSLKRFFSVRAFVYYFFFLMS